MATPYATLINAQGKKAVVLSGSPEASDLMAQGYKLQTSGGAAPTTTATAGGNQAQLEDNASIYNTLNGSSQGNPYIAYLQPRVITGPDGKRYLRMPKNQQMIDLAKFFETNQSNAVKRLTDFARMQNDAAKLQLDTAQTQYNINKPYYAPKKSTTTSTDPNSPNFKVPSLKIAKTSTGGKLFLAKQKSGAYKPITAAEYSAYSGQNITDLLADSTDPNDKAILDRVAQLEQDVQNGSMTVDEAGKQLEQQYPYVFGTS